VTDHQLPARICLATTELALGGAEKCLANLACGLPPEHFSVRVLSLAPLPDPPKDALRKQLQDAGIPLDTLNLTSVRQLISGTRRFRDYLDEHEIDLLQTFLYHANVLGALAKKKTPDLIQVSGIRVADPSGWRQLLERRAKRRWSHTVCVSQDVATFASARLGLAENQLSVISNGINADHYSNIQSDRNTILGTTSAKRWLLTIGRLESQKGLDWLLALAPALLQQCPQYDLVLVGDGSQRSRLQQQARQAGIADRLHFLGWRADIPQILNASDILLLPSRWEGMPNVLLEAMASSLPVVTRAVQGVEEILESAGELQIVQDDAPAAFVQRVTQLVADPDRRAALGRQNRERILVAFTLPQMVQQYGSLYRQLVQAR
jgi:glycosyltransferase involved in cell wall biosynthesis